VILSAPLQCKLWVDQPATTGTDGHNSGRLVRRRPRNRSRAMLSSKLGDWEDDVASCAKRQALGLYERTSPEKIDSDSVWVRVEGDKKVVQGAQPKVTEDFANAVGGGELQDLRLDQLQIS